MKRSQALRSLSRDHHHALVVARDLTRANAEIAAATAERFVEFLAHHERAHFDLEEAVLLPLMPSSAPAAELAQRMVDDHAWLREAMRRLQADRSPEVDALRSVGQRLREHVQMEERELFPYLERVLGEDELKAIGARLQAAERAGAQPGG